MLFQKNMLVKNWKVGMNNPKVYLDEFWAMGCDEMLNSIEILNLSIKLFLCIRSH
jgi:hypothetical protein